MSLFGKARGQQTTMKMTTKSGGEAGAPGECFSELYVQQSLQKLGDRIFTRFQWGTYERAFEHFCWRVFPFYTKVINPPLYDPNPHTPTHTHTLLVNPALNFSAYWAAPCLCPCTSVWIASWDALLTSVCLHGAFSDWQIKRGMLNLFIFKNKNIKEHGAGQFYLY